MRTVIRRSIALLSVVTLMLGVSALRSPAAMAAATCTTTVTVNYSVQVCLTAPDSGATALTGNTTVTATQSSPAVAVLIPACSAASADLNFTVLPADGHFFGSWVTYTATSPGCGA